MPRFVVLEHDSPAGLHWDFMLQRGEKLATWALASPPDAAASVAATALADHRAAYLEYEGLVSGERGVVRRWDAGHYQCLDWDADRVVVETAGIRLAGRVTLVRSGSQGDSWTFTFQQTQRGQRP